MNTVAFSFTCNVNFSKDEGRKTPKISANFVSAIFICELQCIYIDYIKIYLNIYSLILIYQHYLPEQIFPIIFIKL